MLRSLMADRPAQRVLVLSAVGDVTSKVRCLDLGAADYLPKPFAVAELVARVRARLRQSAPERNGRNERWLHAGGVTRDTARRVAEYQGRSVIGDKFQVPCSKYQVLSKKVLFFWAKQLFE